MKPKTSILIVTVAIGILLNSCIVKSLQPFYIKKHLSFNKALLGNWVDNKKGQWTVEAISAKMEADKKSDAKFSDEDLKIYETYNKGYYITHLKKNKEAGFIAMPFKVNDTYFLDFIPIDIEDNEINSLAAKHLLKTHSVAKLNIKANKAVSLTWLNEERITTLFEEQKIRLKHEKIGFENDLLITASSEELYEFLKRALDMDMFTTLKKDGEKWNSSDKLILTKINAKP
ncbi:hypothetical protein [uncultured Winogradskyella sp.]|uniref:hypothetical protein n=1 Tax=uncultured Winogradskyella sp. TaxID=395353 RepID=UPI002603A151|nr:hypothetical protein [uncultured Winogradskyella sp.]